MTIIIQIVIALLTVGFILWAARKLIALVPLDAMFKQVTDVLLTILVAAIILFYVVTPLLHLLAGTDIRIT